MLWSVPSQSETPEGVPSGVIQLSESTYYNPHIIVVDKSARVLTVWKQDGDQLKKVTEYPSDIGKFNGNKKRLGDHRTPEGIYFIQEMYEGANLPFELYGKRAFTLDYPNLFDKRAGKTGSGIWIHAIPDTETLERGSRGCVVVRNDAIMDLSQYIITGNKTPVLIYDAITYHSAEDRKRLNSEIETTLGKWLQAWKSKDMDKYISFYSERFNSLRMNRDKWRRYKAGLAKRYDDIHVSLYSPMVLEHDGGYIVRALQTYRSNMLEDFGEKILFLERTDDGLKIIAEQWAAIPKDPDITQKLARCCSLPSQASN